MTKKRNKWRPRLPHRPQAAVPIFCAVRAQGEAYRVQLFVGKISAAAALNVRAPQVLSIVSASEKSERSQCGTALST